jgi:hypothetical protein
MNRYVAMDRACSNHMEGTLTQGLSEGSVIIIDGTGAWLYAVGLFADHAENIFLLSKKR